MKWWQLDFTYQIIQLLERSRLIWKVRLIPAAQNGKQGAENTSVRGSGLKS